MREDSRPTDAFAWTRPWVPYGDDPFVWYDPSEDMKTAAAPVPANDTREAPRAAAEAAVAPPTTAARTDTGRDEIWVELPATEDRPKRPRRGRGRGRGGEGSADGAVADAPTAAPEPEAVVTLEPAPAPEVVVAETTPAGKKPRASRAKAKPAPLVEVVAEAALQPVAAPEPEPVAVTPREQPDPAEISAPPAAPRKGWWRRG